jgi:hypothetical protein
VKLDFGDHNWILVHGLGIKCWRRKSRLPITLIMRAEYSESNNSKMIALDLLRHTNINLPPARGIDSDDEQVMFNFSEEAVIGSNNESNSTVLVPVSPWLDQGSNSSMRKCSRLLYVKKGVAEEGKFSLPNDTDGNSDGITVQW